MYTQELSSYRRGKKIVVHVVAVKEPPTAACTQNHSFLSLGSAQVVQVSSSSRVGDVVPGLAVWNNTVAYFLADQRNFFYEPNVISNGFHDIP